MATGYYFREVTDQPWRLTFVGTIPSLPGGFLLLHDSHHRVIAKRHIPHGQYPPDEPFAIEVPADGRVGDYRLLILGQQEDLPEVYQCNYWSQLSPTRFFTRSTNADDELKLMPKLE